MVSVPTISQSPRSVSASTSSRTLDETRTRPASSRLVRLLGVGRPRNHRQPPCAAHACMHLSTRLYLLSDIFDPICPRWHRTHIVNRADQPIDISYLQTRTAFLSLARNLFVALSCYPSIMLSDITADSFTDLSAPTIPCPSRLSVSSVPLECILLFHRSLPWLGNSSRRCARSCNPLLHQLARQHASD